MAMTVVGSKKISLIGALFAFAISFALGSGGAFAVSVYLSEDSAVDSWTASSGYTYKNMARIQGYNNVENGTTAYYVRSYAYISPTNYGMGSGWMWVRAYIYRGNNAIYSYSSWIGNGSTINENSWFGHGVYVRNPNSGGLGWYSWDTVQVYNGSGYDSPRGTYQSPTIYYP